MNQLQAAAILLTALALAASPAGAQIAGKDPRDLVREEMLRERLREQAELRRRIQQYTFPYNTLPRDAPLEFHLGYRPGLQRMFPRYEGLPTYPGNVPGYGGYPGAGRNPDEVEALDPIPSLERPARDKGRWPSWIEGGTTEKPMRASPGQSVLVRVTDRVWFLAPGEKAYIPLVFHDRFRFMTVGSRVEVRGKGEYQVIMHDAAFIRSRGPSSLAVVAMNESEASLRLGDFTYTWIQARLRPIRVLCPDGTQLDFADTLLYLERRGDHCHVANLGSGPIEFSGPAVQGKLEGPVSIKLWMQPQGEVAAGEALQLSGSVSMTRSADVTTVRGGQDGKVVWSGASFTLEEGSALVLEPLDPAQSPR